MRSHFRGTLGPLNLVSLLILTVMDQSPLNGHNYSTVHGSNESDKEKERKWDLWNINKWSNFAENPLIHLSANEEYLNMLCKSRRTLYVFGSSGQFGYSTRIICPAYQGLTNIYIYLHTQKKLKCSPR